MLNFNIKFQTFSILSSGKLKPLRFFAVETLLEFTGIILSDFQA